MNEEKSLRLDDVLYSRIISREETEWGVTETRLEQRVYTGLNRRWTIVQTDKSSGGITLAQDRRPISGDEAARIRLSIEQQENTAS